MDPRIGGVGVYHMVLAEKASWKKGLGLLKGLGFCKIFVWVLEKPLRARL